MVCAKASCLRSDFDVKVLAVETGDEFVCGGEFERGADILPDPGGGGGSERQADRFREALAHLDDLAIFGAEVVAPLRDAVRFVDREQVHFHAARSERMRGVRSVSGAT